MNVKSQSKFLSLILKHKPKVINIKMDKNGWINVEELIQKMNEHNNKITINGDILLINIFSFYFLNMFLLILLVIQDIQIFLK